MAKVPSDDPAYWMLLDPDIHSQPQVHLRSCYICTDDEYMRMGLPLCRPCCQCTINKLNQSPRLPVNPKKPQLNEPGYGHIPADDEVCGFCGHRCGPGTPNCIYENY